MSCALGGTTCTESILVKDPQTGERIQTCHKHTTITNILRKMQGEPQYRRVDGD